jgi:hypothetical protein
MSTKKKTSKNFSKYCLIAITFLMTGCNSLPVELLSKATKVEPVRKDVVPDEMKEYAKNVLDYGDYYMKELVEKSKAGEGIDGQTLKTGMDLMTEEMQNASALSKRLFPKLEDEAVKVAKQCNVSVTFFIVAYLGLTTYVLVPSDRTDLKTEWDKVIQPRAKMIKDCQL